MPYDDLLDTAARIGVSEDRFWRMSLIEFRRLSAVYVEQQKAKVELEQAQQEAALRRAAWVCATIMNFAGKQLRKGKKVNIEDLIQKRKTDDDLAQSRRELIRRHCLAKRFGIRET